MGLDVQEAAIREWALQGTYRVVEVLREEGVSGTKELDERPALLEAFASLRDRRASIILVARLDRLARDLIVQEQLLRIHLLQVPIDLRPGGLFGFFKRRNGS